LGQKKIAVEGSPMLKRFAIHVSALVAFIVPPATCLSSLAIAQLVKNPSAYDGKHVSVSGSVKHLQREVSPDGRAFVIFSLCVTSACVNVFGLGSSVLRDNQVIAVQGTFNAVKVFGGYKFHDAIEADNGSL
jgi:hypothetical protein